MVFFQFRRADAIGDAFFSERLVIFLENDGGNTFVLVFRRNADQVKKHFLAVLARLQKVPEPEREKLSLGFLLGL